MTLIFYPIILIVAVIMFYILGQKNGTVKEIEIKQNVIDHTPLYYDEENRDQFVLRCYNYILQRFNDAGYSYHVSTDESSFKLSFEEADGTVINYHVDIMYSEGKRVIMFYSRITDKTIPDHKLAEVSELVNRLNDTLLVNALVLNYEHRVIESKLIYIIGRHGIIDDYFTAYYNIMFYSSDFRSAFNRVVYRNENPALVALEWGNQ